MLIVKPSIYLEYISNLLGKGYNFLSNKTIYYRMACKYRNNKQSISPEMREQPIEEEFAVSGV